MDDLKGLPRAIEAILPHTYVQLCIAHMVRHSLNYAPWKQLAEAAADLKRTYQSRTTDQAESLPCEFEAKYDHDYLPIGQPWRRNWQKITPPLDFPPKIRKAIHTTNAIESVNMSPRKITKNQGSPPSDETMLKMSSPTLKKWTTPIRDWKAELTRLKISHEGRLPQ